jgi:hypothetical protein
VEEARQHTAVTAEQSAFAGVFFAGHAVLLSGIIAVAAGYDNGITFGIVGLAGSKIALAVWALARPAVQSVQRSKLARVVVAIGWTTAAGLLIWIGMNK